MRSHIPNGTISEVMRNLRLEQTIATAIPTRLWQLWLFAVGRRGPEIRENRKQIVF
jgi:hypothetical protein